MPANTPPASDPLVGQIGQHVLETVKGIPALHASEGGFYYHDYTADRPRPKLHGDFVDGRVLVVQGMTEQQEEMSNTCSLGLQTYFTLRVDATVSQRDDQSLDRKLNLRVADLLRAVLKDPQRGGIAINTDFAYADGPEQTPDLTKGRVDLVFLIQHQQSRLDPTAF